VAGVLLTAGNALHAMSDQDAKRIISGMDIARQGGATSAGESNYCPHWVSNEEDLCLVDGKSPFMDPGKFSVDDLRYITNVKAAKYGVKDMLEFMYETLHTTIQRIVHKLMSSGTQISKWRSLEYENRCEAVKQVWKPTRVEYLENNPAQVQDYLSRTSRSRAPTVGSNIWRTLVEVVDVATLWQLTDEVLARTQIPNSPVKRKKPAAPHKNALETYKDAVYALSERVARLKELAVEIHDAVAAEHSAKAPLTDLTKKLLALDEAISDAVSIAPDSSLEVRSKLHAAIAVDLSDDDSTQSTTVAQSDATVELDQLRGDGHCAYHAHEKLHNKEYNQYGPSYPTEVIMRRATVAALALSSDSPFFLKNMPSDLSREAVAARCLSNKEHAGEIEGHLVALSLNITIYVALSYTDCMTTLGDPEAPRCAYQIFTGGHYNALKFTNSEGPFYIVDKSDSALRMKAEALIRELREKDKTSNPAHAQLKAYNKDSRARVASQVAAVKASKKVTIANKQQRFLHGFPGAASNVLQMLSNAGINTSLISDLGGPPKGSKGLGPRLIEFVDEKSAALVIKKMRECYPGNSIRKRANPQQHQKKPVKEACRDHARGKCSRKKCKYSHEPASKGKGPTKGKGSSKGKGSTKKSQNEMLQACFKNFLAAQQGVANIPVVVGTDPSARIAQIVSQVKSNGPCRYPAAGQICPFGQKCKFDHPHPPLYADVLRRSLLAQAPAIQPAPLTQVPAVQYVSQNGVPRLPLTQFHNSQQQYVAQGVPVTQTHNPQAYRCRDFARGTCSRRHCRYSHAQ